MDDRFRWDPPALDAADERLIEVYKYVGRSLDDLPYTEEFEKLYAQVSSGDESQMGRHVVWRRLLRLRKTGRLPRLGLVPERFA